MCLAVPGRIVKKEGDYATVDFGGVKKKIKIVLTPSVNKGDWVIVHSGFSIQILDKKETKLLKMI